MKLYIPAPYYGFDHTVVKEKFEGKPEFLCETCIDGKYSPVAVYYVAKPNRKLDHKTYMFLFKDEKQIYVGGRHAKDMKKWRYQQGMFCPKCDSVIYSINRHDFHNCSCGELFVDGGRDYLRSGGAGFPVMVDLFEKRVKFYKKYYHNAKGRHAPKSVRANKWYPLEYGDGLKRAKQKAKEKMK